MASVNKCIFIGNLGRDPELRFMPDGTAACNFSIACTESWKDKSGEKKEVTEWVRISAFKKLAEICGEYLKKGSQVYIEGRMSTRKWTDKDGTEKYTTEIIANEMRMLGARQDTAPAKERNAPGKSAAKPADDWDENQDIPF